VVYGSGPAWHGPELGQPIGVQLRVERRGGELLQTMPKNPGVRIVGGSIVEPPGIPTLKQLGIEKHEAMRWQQIGEFYHRA